MSKSAVYSWRLKPGLKARLERRARCEGVSLSALLDRLASEWLDGSALGESGDDAEQAALHAAALATVGTIHGGDPRRSERAREAVRERLSRRRHAS